MKKNTFTIAAALVLALGGISGCDRLRNFSEQELVQRAKDFQERGDLKASVIELKNALQKNPNNAEARWMLGEIYIQAGQGNEAEKELLKARQLGVDAESLVVPLGQARILQRQYAKVLDETQPSEKTSTRNLARILQVRGEALLGQKKVKEGCAELNRSFQTDASNAPTYWGLAKCAVFSGKPDEARVQLESALKVEPINATTWMLIGDLERVRNNYEKAESAYTTALKYRPQHFDALAGRASTRILRNQLAEAEKDIGAIDALVKDHPQANQMKGIIQYKRAKFVEAKTFFETVLKVMPDFAPARLWLGLTNFALKNHEQAAMQFAGYLQHYPGAVQVRAMLALSQAKAAGGAAAAAETLKQLSRINLEDPQSLATLGEAYFITGQSELSAQYFSKAVEKQPDSPESRISLAYVQLQKGETGQAIAHLEKALQLNPRAPGADELLIQALLKEKKLDKAVQAVKMFQDKYPNDPLPYNYKGTVLLLNNDREDAKEAFLKSLQLQPGFFPAAHNLAQMAISKGDFEQARGHYRAVLKSQKNELAAFKALYDLELKAKRPDEATKVLRQTLAKFPAEPMPAMLLARTLLSANNPLQVLEVTQAAAVANPNHIGLLEVRILASLAVGDSGNALSGTQRLAQAQPNSPDSYYYQARAYALSGNARAARMALQESLKRDPAYVIAKAALARLDVAEGKYEEALQLARELQKSDAKSPNGFLIEAEMQAKQKNYQGAITVLDEAKKKFPASEEVMALITRMRLASGDKEGAILSAVKWQQANPNQPSASRFLAETYLALGRRKEAVDAYEMAVKLDPNDAGVLNNLALLLAETSPSRALQLAEKSTSLKPGSPAYADTYGWLLIGQGQAARGVELLQKAFALAPTSPDIHYHYAAALVKAGEKEKGRRELQRLLATGKKFAEESAARKLLQQL